MQAFRLHPLSSNVFSPTVAEHQKAFGTFGSSNQRPGSTGGPNQRPGSTGGPIQRPGCTGVQPSLVSAASYDMSPFQKSISAPDLRRGVKVPVRSRKHTQHTRRQIWSAQSDKPPVPNFKCGSTRALARDRLFQLELQEKWKIDLEKELGPSLQHKHEQPLFEFDKKSPNEDRSFVTPWLQNSPVLEAAMAKSLPAYEAIPFPEIPAATHQRLNEALDLWATVSHPSLQSPPDRFYRPAFCRLLIDTGIVDCERAGAGVPYHRAVRGFDAMALATTKTEDAGSGGLLGTLPCVSFDHVCELVNQLLCQSDEPVAAQKNFFDKGLDTMTHIGRALQVRHREQMRSRGRERPETPGANINPNLVSTKFRKECLSIHGAPPRIFEGFVTDWTSGLDDWMHLGDTQTTVKAIEKQSDIESALDNYIMDTVVEPGVLYFARVCEPVFFRIFQVYADETRKQWDEKGNVKHAKHLSFAAFFRFCIDFGVFPSLCSFEFAKRAYGEAECVEELGAPPVKEKSEEDSLSGMSEEYTSPMMKSSGARKLSNAVLAVAFMKQNMPDMTNARSSIASALAGAASRRNSFNMGSDGRALATENRKASFAGMVDIVTGGIGGRPRRNSLATASTKRSGSFSSLGSDDHMDHMKRQTSHERRRTASGVPDMSLLPESKKSGALKVPHEAVQKKPPGNKARGSTKQPPLQQPRSRNGSKALPKASPIPTPRKQLTPIDMSWLKTSFSHMSEERLKAYALLRALGHCSSDSFQSIVGLFDNALDTDSDLSDSEPEDDNASKKSKTPVCEKMVDASDFLDALSKLHVKHSWDIEDAETFVNILCPDSEGSTIRLLDLDKAVGRVREDMQRRYGKDPSFMGDSDAFYRSTEYEFNECGPARSPLGNLALGDEAREVEREPGWLCKAGETTTSVLFGTAAFMESLLRIAVEHLHSTGAPAKAAMPGGAKAAWLLTHLNHRFNRIAAGEKPKRSPSPSPEQSPKQSPKAAPLPKVVNRSPRPRTPEKAKEKEERRPTAPAGRHYRSMSVQLGSLPTNLLVERPRSGTGSIRKDSNAGLATKLPGYGMPAVPTKKGQSPRERERRDSRDTDGGDFSLIPNDLTYVPKRMRAVQKHPALFECLPWLSKNASAHPPCETCSCPESKDGFGNMHCHACSGIDGMRLADSPLWPLLNRKRLRSEMQKQAELSQQVATPPIAPVQEEDL